MAESEQKPIEQTPPSISEAIEKIMANPELISTVAAALGKSAPVTDTAEKKEPPSETIPQGTADAVAALAPILAGLKGGGSKPPEDDRSRLLYALKPYVNSSRRNAIDTLLRFSQITELLKRLN